VAAAKVSLFKRLPDHLLEQEEEAVVAFLEAVVEVFESSKVSFRLVKKGLAEVAEGSVVWEPKHETLGAILAVVVSFVRRRLLKEYS
jgi:hypothetical protein